MFVFGTVRYKRKNPRSRVRRSRDHYIKHGMITVRAPPYLIRVARHILLIQALRSLKHSRRVLPPLSSAWQADESACSSSEVKSTSFPLKGRTSKALSWDVSFSSSVMVRSKTSQKHSQLKAFAIFKFLLNWWGSCKQSPKSQELKF